MPTIEEDLETLRSRIDDSCAREALTRIRAALAELRYHRANAVLVKDFRDEQAKI